MPFRPAPTTSDASGKTAVLYCNLGTPDAPTAPAVRRYLAEFLSDPRVVEIPRLAWWPILHGIILRVRPAKSAAKYASVWTPQGSALKVWTEQQTGGLRSLLAERGHRVGVHYAMRYGQPAIAAQLDALVAEGVTRLLVLQAYPQYSGTTTASVLDAVGAWSRRQRRLPEFRFVNDYHDDAGYIAALADSVERHWAQHGRGELLLMSFHGIPARNIALGDPYQAQCQATARLLARRLGLTEQQYRLSFQSRFGRAKWLEPYTEPTLRALAQQGTKRIDVMCPGFPVDCLETLEEINMEAREAFLASGGETFSYIPCLNDSPAWAQALTDLAERHLSGWNTRAGQADQPAVS
ncbi:ferrochelatase [Pseudorhodoferax sp. Leaf265]|uniref:ferrochelatase n=1 Tax=Pseudorhodoferax sp. Leaf265 TaxID=1736315 RepID=UPI0006F89BBB|nr:ferrochelatase [Pseudorhodoferax sp. Leaf265]KQP19939.1 ferrochelatase [Pseudorhodoferax sp. Leaf265]